MKQKRKAAPKKPAVVGRIVKRGENGNRAYVLRYDPAWQDNIVQFFIDGIHQTKADGHFYDDKEDAIQTAENWLAASPANKANPIRPSHKGKTPKMLYVVKVVMSAAVIKQMKIPKAAQQFVQIYRTKSAALKNAKDNMIFGKVTCTEVSESELQDAAFMKLIGND